MVTAAQIGRMRERAESRMTDTCRISKAAADVWNPVTATYDPGPAVYSYEGPCMVKYGATQSRIVDAAGQQQTLQIVEIKLPVATSGDVVVGQIVEVVASAFDQSLPGRKFRVNGPAGGSAVASRRFPVEEVIVREG